PTCRTRSDKAATACCVVHTTMMCGTCTGERSHSGAGHDVVSLDDRDVTRMSSLLTGKTASYRSAAATASTVAAQYDELKVAVSTAFDAGFDAVTDSCPTLCGMLDGVPGRLCRSIDALCDNREKAIEAAAEGEAGSGDDLLLHVDVLR